MKGKKEWLVLSIAIKSVNLNNFNAASSYSRVGLVPTGSV